MADEIYKPKMVSGSVSMTFDRSLGIETTESEVYGDDSHIMEDGTIKVYRRWYKKVLYLDIKGINQSTFNALRNLRRNGNAVDYYRDRNDSTKYGTFMWQGDWDITEEIYTKDAFGLYTGQLVLREV